MIDSLVRAACMIAIMLLGYVLKRIRFLDESAAKVLSKIIVNITIPCVLVSNLARYDFDFKLFWLAGLMILVNIVWFAAALISERKGTGESRAFAVCNYSGTNTSNFIIPYVTYVLPAGVVPISIADIGNALSVYGLTFPYAEQQMRGGKIGFGSYLKNIFRIVPMNFLLAMIILKLLHVQIPERILSLFDIGMQANTFLAMLMIGIAMEFRIPKTKMRRLGKALLARYPIAIAAAVLVWFFLPFDVEIRKAIAILLLAPVPASSTAFTEQIGNDTELAATLETVTVFISLALIMTFIAVVS